MLGKWDPFFDSDTESVDCEPITYGTGGAGRDRRQRTVSASGGATLKHTFFSMLKSFVGSGLLFLPEGFRNGGMVFSPLILMVSAIVTVYCMRRLVDCLARLPGATYGDVMEAAWGASGRLAVDVSVFLSQIGFFSAGTIFIAQSVVQVAKSQTEGGCGDPGFAEWHVIVAQAAVMVPMVWVRKLKYYSIPCLLADAAIAFGAIYILTYCTVKVGQGEGEPVELFNRHDFLVFLGTAVYTFEGIGLVAPLYGSLQPQDKPRYSNMLSATVFGLAVFLCLFASVGYAAFGADVKTAVILNLPQATVITQVVQGTYVVGLILGQPLCIFPAIDIFERYILQPGSITRRRLANASGVTASFSDADAAQKPLLVHAQPPQPQSDRRSMDYAALSPSWADARLPFNSRSRMWFKNLLRAAVVGLATLLAVAAKAQLTNFVSLIGCVCCVPLMFIYPPLCHRRLVGGSATQRVLNVCVVVLGLLIMGLTSYECIVSWASNSGGSGDDDCA